jgi:hypothetical protein
MPVPVDQIKQALNDLGLEAPKVSTSRLPGNVVSVQVTARCRPDKIVTVKVTPIADEEPAHMVPQPAEGLTETSAPADDLTLIPGIGKATAAKLVAAGFNSFSSLANATDQELLQFVSPSTLYNVRAWTS